LEWELNEGDGSSTNASGEDGTVRAMTAVELISFPPLETETREDCPVGYDTTSWRQMHRHFA
jgi:hypothetical protein